MVNDTNHPQLSNAPITEALIDFQVRSQELPTEKTLQVVVKSIEQEFPNIEARHKATIGFKAEENETTSNFTQEPIGFILRNKEKHYAAQIMRDRFSLSRLSPYTDWKDLRNEANRIWMIYRDITKPEQIVRLGVRYINRLLLPYPIKEFSDYFTKPIEIPDGLPQGLAGYMTRIVVPEPETNSIATIQQVFEGVTPDNQSAIIFDIDAFKNVDLSADNEKEIWSCLEDLRTYKNNIFYRTLTNNTVKLYK